MLNALDLLCAGDFSILNNMLRVVLLPRLSHATIETVNVAT